jgi:hypothetical protein
MEDIKKCQKCNKKIRAIKNDFKSRKFCKKCHFENEKEWEFKTFMTHYNKYNGNLS